MNYSNYSIQGYGDYDGSINGYEDLGFGKKLKKLGKRVGKLAKKIAPIALPVAAGFIPGGSIVSSLVPTGGGGGKAPKAPKVKRTTRVRRATPRRSVGARVVRRPTTVSLLRNRMGSQGARPAAVRTAAAASSSRGNWIQRTLRRNRNTIGSILDNVFGDGGGGTDPQSGGGEPGWGGGDSGTNTSGGGWGRSRNRTGGGTNNQGDSGGGTSLLQNPVVLVGGVALLGIALMAMNKRK